MEHRSTAALAFPSQKESRTLPTIFLRGEGNSLLPLVDKKCLLEVERQSLSSIQPGDLIVFCAGKTLICHRALWRKKEKNHLWFFITGNHPMRADGWIPDYRIIGKVVSIDGKPIPRLKNFFLRWHSAMEIAIIHKLLEPIRWRHFPFLPQLIKAFVILSAIPLPKLLCWRFELEFLSNRNGAKAVSVPTKIIAS